eukprot:EG_transcript_13578
MYEHTDDEDEHVVRVRNEEKGGRINAGQKARAWNRRWGFDPLLVRRFQWQVVPLWAVDPPKLVKPPVRLTTAEFSMGYDGLVRSMLREVRKDIAALSPFGERCQVRRARVAPDVVARFMERYAALAAQGVTPRILYHGTPPEKLDSIRKRGLLPPAKLMPDQQHYTDAIWTATEPRTSVHHCYDGHVMFACAVLDDHVGEAAEEVAEASTEEEQEEEDEEEEEEEEEEENEEEAEAEAEEKPPHRHPHTPLTRASQQAKQPKRPVESIDEWVVAVRDEALICPCVEIEWELEPPESGLEQLEVPLRNWNTQREDHALQTLAALYREDTRHPDRHAMHFGWIRAKRSRDLERRRLRTVKTGF